MAESIPLAVLLRAELVPAHQSAGDDGAQQVWVYKSALTGLRLSPGS